MQAREAQRQIQNAIRQTDAETSRGLNMSIDATARAFVSVALGSAADYRRWARSEESA